MTKPIKATIHDVAKEAGVSTATVSRVINDKDKVSKQTRERVMDAAESLGFLNKHSVLSDIDSKTILVCLTELKNPFNVPVIDGIQDSAYQSGYDTLLLQTKHLYTEYKDYESVLKSQRFAGVVFLSSVTSAQLKIITDQLTSKTPIVFCSEYVEDVDIPYTCIDDEAAMSKSTEYILSLGRRKIAFVNSSHQHSYAKKREVGFRKTMKEHGVPINEAAVINLSSVTYNLAYSNVLHLLSADEKPDAIICVSDVYAIAAINACQKMGVKVPEDCAVIGFDNIDLANMVNPPLTTIDQPCYQLGYQACELLIEKVANPNTPTKRIKLDTELIIRGSTPITIKK